jgi:hypothetical protein
MDYRIEHDFKSSADAVQQATFFDETFCRQLYQHLKLQIESFETRSETNAGGERVIRDLKFVAERQASGPLAKLLKGQSLVTQRETFDCAAKTLKVEIQLPVIGKRVEMGGLYTWQDLGDNGCRRTWAGYCSASIPLLGRKIERFLVDETHTSMAQTFDFTADWLTK